jgi:hypothetical protein
MRFVFANRINLLFGIRTVRHLGQLLSVSGTWSPLLEGAARVRDVFARKPHQAYTSLFKHAILKDLSSSVGRSQRDYDPMIGGVCEGQVVTMPKFTSRSKAFPSKWQEGVSLNPVHNTIIILLTERQNSLLFA